MIGTFACCLESQSSTGLWSNLLHTHMIATCACCLESQSSTGLWSNAVTSVKRRNGWSAHFSRLHLGQVGTFLPIFLLHISLLPLSFCLFSPTYLLTYFWPRTTTTKSEQLGSTHSSTVHPVLNKDLLTFSMVSWVKRGINKEDEEKRKQGEEEDRRQGERRKRKKQKKKMKKKKQTKKRPQKREHEGWDEMKAS